MSFIEDFLFGKEGTGPQVVDTTPDQFTALRNPVSSSLTGLINSGGGPKYSGPFAAGLTTAQKNILSNINSLGSGPTALQQQGRGVLSKTLAGDYLSPSSNPFLQDSIDAATRGTIRNFKEFQLPRLQGSFTAAGHTIQPGGSSPFDRAAALAQGDTLNAVADIATNIASQNFQQERSRQNSAVAQAEQITGQDLNRAIQTLQANELPRLIEQLGIDRGLEEFRRQVNTLLQSIGQAGNLSQGAIATLPGTPGTEGAIGDIVGGAITGGISGAGGIGAIADLFA